MEAGDYLAEASLYYAKSPNRRQKALVFRRFEQAAEAIRYAIEELSPEILKGSTLEIDDTLYMGQQIRPLYDDTAFPLRRRAK